LDPRLYAEGLAFFQHNILGVVASNGEALVMGLSIPSFYRAVPLGRDFFLNLFIRSADFSVNGDL
jgi:hypothetical protein